MWDMLPVKSVQKAEPLALQNGIWEAGRSIRAPETGATGKGNRGQLERRFGGKIDRIWPLVVHGHRNYGSEQSLKLPNMELLPEQ